MVIAVNGSVVVAVAVPVTLTDGATRVASLSPLSLTSTDTPRPGPELISPGGGEMVVIVSEAPLKTVKSLEVVWGTDTTPPLFWSVPPPVTMNEAGPPAMLTDSLQV